MIVKWRWVQHLDRQWVDNLIGYSKCNKEHIQYFAQAIKYLDRPDCIRLIVEKADFKE